MEDPFNRLPAPLLLTILKEIEDPLSLVNLTEASPSVASLFCECYLEITRNVLSRCLHPQIQQLAFAMMNKRAAGFQGVESLQASLEPGDRCPAPHGLLTFPLRIGGHSWEAARSILITVTWIQAKAWAILKYLLQWTNKLRLFHIADPSLLLHVRLFRSPSEVEYWRDRKNWAHQQPAPTVEYTPARCSMPSWSEVHRVHRALWRLELYREHLDVMHDERNSVVMMQKRNAIPEAVLLAEFWRSLPGWAVDEIQSVLGAYEVSCQGTLPLGESFASEAIPAELFSPYQTTNGAIDHQCEITHHFEDMMRNTEWPASGWKFILCGGSRHPRSLIDRNDFPLFKQAGLNIWDKDRLAGLELLKPRRDQATPCGSEVIAGKSLSIKELSFTWKMVAYKNFY